jgi:hypothetical protein
MAVVLQGAPVQQNASPANFVGTWVGVQTWAIAGAPPSAKTPQQVTLEIQLVDGKLVGTMPFFGGTDLATFVDTKIIGDELEASAVVKRQPTPETADQRPPQRAWFDDVKITFRLKADKAALTGTSDVLMGDVKWMTFKYDLGKKRSRY